VGTHCYIAKKQENEVYRSIFCQLDGYPEVTGDLLVKHYNTPEALDALLSLGDIYRLREKLESDYAPLHESTDYRLEGVTEAFGRDLGWTGRETKDRTLDEMLDCEEFIEFVYVFTDKQEWEFCHTLDCDMEFRKVQDFLEASESQEQTDSPAEDDPADISMAGW